jgi:hypothetical protein
VARYRTYAPYHKRYQPVSGVMAITHPLYSIWGAMKDRCCNTDSPGYVNYGGRGITVCAEWISSFEQFALDMGEKPSKYHSLDRINNDAGYSKDNCRWATKSQQMLNRRRFKNNTSGVRGVATKSNGTFIARHDINGVRYHLGYFQNIDDAAAYRKRFIDLLQSDHDAALAMTDRRPRYDSGTQVLGITGHDAGFMIRKTIAGKRIFIGLANTLEQAVAMKNEFESMALIDLAAAIAYVSNRPRASNKTRIRGISKHGDGFTVRKTINGKQVYLGIRSTIEEAIELWKNS